MKITCYIVDDEIHAIETLRALIEKIPELELIGFSDSPITALNELRNIRPDMIFLDIEMPDVSGLEFANFVNKKSLVIFTTAHQDHALEAFDKSAFDYLVKPIMFERFYKCFYRAKSNFPLKQRHKNEQKIFFIKTHLRGKYDKIQIDEIFYIKAGENYVHFNFISHSQMAYQTLSEVVDYLPYKNFTRIHRSYVVHHSAVKSWEPGRLLLSNGVELPIGREFKAHVAEKFDEFILKSHREN